MSKKKRKWHDTEGYHWFSAFMGFMGAFCLAYARVWRIPDLSPLQVVFMFAFLIVSGGDHLKKAFAVRRERRTV
jgi:hypothetical protein